MKKDEVGAKIKGAIDYLNANPAEARYTDSYATARLADPAGLKVEVEGPNGARINDRHAHFRGGTNIKASSGWYLRARLERVA